MPPSQDAYTASKLWTSIIAAPAHDEYAQQREGLSVSYVSLCERAAYIVAQAPRDGLPFTVHDITHVDALWETADLVCGAETSLTPAEGYVLGCAFVLHDAAMCRAAYKEDLSAVVGPQIWRDMLAHAHFARNDCWPDESELDSPSVDVVKDCESRVSPRDSRSLRHATRGRVMAVRCRQPATRPIPKVQTSRRRRTQY